MPCKRKRSSQDSKKKSKSKKIALSPVSSDSIGVIEANQKVLSRANSSSLEDIRTNTPTSEYRPRKKTYDTIPETIAQYKSDLSSVWVDKITEIHPWYQAEPIILHCKVIDPQRCPVGFISANTEAGKREGRYQYDVTKPLKTAKRYRPNAYRTTFLDHPDFTNKKLTVSHLCHNSSCYNWDHHVLESLEANKSRNGCVGGPHCQHTTKCLIPGKDCAL